MKTLAQEARTIFEQALDACSIEKALARNLSLQADGLQICGQAVPLDDVRHLRIVAVGKAAGPMLSALLKHLPLRPTGDLAGVLIAPEATAPLPKNFQYFPGGHPTPNQASFEGARAALTLLQAMPPEQAQNTLCVFLLSGGASAMMELPLGPAIGLADTGDFHRALVGCGASITEINCVRKHFSAVKGGRLAVAARNSIAVSMFVSDVPAGHEDAIGSGPTLPDPSTRKECRDILERYELLPRFPALVRRFFESAALPETPRVPPAQRASCVLLHPDDLAEAAAARARLLGWTAVIDHTSDEWEYQAAAEYLADRVRVLRQQFPRVCLIGGGEVIVRLPASGEGDVGTGGRNQQFALYAARLLRDENHPVAILSAGSDGIDGNSPAAGAAIDPATLVGDEVALLADRALASFDAYPLLEGLGATIMTGPTGNNLRDLRILLAGSHAPDVQRDSQPDKFHKP
ncbi:MAG: glycerate kinase type-2 family protein [Acidobacteriaceae bacterium]